MPYNVQLSFKYLISSHLYRSVFESEAVLSTVLDGVYTLDGNGSSLELGYHFNSAQIFDSIISCANIMSIAQYCFQIFKLADIVL
jgi:hypothetical protein